MKAGAEIDGCRCCRHGFTLIELLVSITIIAILAALLLPALSKAKANSKEVPCLQNLKQLQMACQMYAADNGGKLVPNTQDLNAAQSVPDLTPSVPTRWVSGNMLNAQDATNVNYLLAGKLYPYAPQPATYHCPADLSATNGAARVRSYSMNSWLGSRMMEDEQTAFRTFMTEADLSAAPTASTWVIADEDKKTLSDGWFEVTMNNSDPFVRFPTARHLNGYALDFADGHSEVYFLRNAATLSALQSPGAYTISSTNPDWIKFTQVTTSMAASDF